jgi:hypothetical protein
MQSVHILSQLFSARLGMTVAASLIVVTVERRLGGVDPYAKAASRERLGN